MFKVYWSNNSVPQSYDAAEIVEALNFAESLRKNEANSFVTIASENPDMVGKPGVSGIQNGKLPNGERYDWNKTRNERRE